MVDVEKAMEPIKNTSWQQRVFAIGGVVGVALGLLAAYLYVQAAEQRGDAGQPDPPSAGDTVRLGVALLAIIRTVTEWGGR